MTARHFNKARMASAAVLVSGLLLFGCMPGTGTDTENGIQVTARVVDTTGAPVRNVEVDVRSLTSRPDTKSENPLVADTIALRTDENGYVHFKVRRPGLYMAQGQRGDSVLVLDTLLAVENDTAVFRTGAVKRLKGKVRLYSGYQIDTGFAFVRGSGVGARIGSDGEYDFGYLPVNAAALTLGVEYAARPIAHVFVKLTDAAGSLVFDSRFSLDSALVPNGGLPSLTLFKAAGTDTKLCLDNEQESVEPGISVKGSVGQAMDVRVGAGYACSQTVGAAIQVDKTDKNGKSTGKLADFVLPDASIWPKTSRGLGTCMKGVKLVVPAECLSSGDSTNFITVLVQDSTGIELHVDDVGLESSCGF
jgi:hypothetical protein